MCTLLLVAFLFKGSICVSVKAMKTKNFNSTELKPDIILRWSDDEEDVRMLCGSNVCLFTSDRSQMARAKTIMFNPSLLSVTDYPLPRKHNQIWALYLDWPTISIPIAHDAILQHFNYTATFSRYSDLPITRHSLNRLTTLDYLVPVKEKSRLRVDEFLAPILFLQNAKGTYTGRLQYVQELMEFIEVDTFGESLHNIDLPENLNYYDSDSEEMLKLMGRYKFILAYENAVCDDYITEKFWRPLIVGAIPVYYGAPTIEDWAPNKKSAIYIKDFTSSSDLADFLYYLDDNDTEYITYLDHKYNKEQRIGNRRLRESLDKNIDSYFRDFGCYLCSQMQRPHPVPVKMASLSHYNCSIATRKPPINFYLYNLSDILHNFGKCLAAALDRLLRLNNPFTKDDISDVMGISC